MESLHECAIGMKEATVVKADAVIGLRLTRMPAVGE